MSTFYRFPYIQASAPYRACQLAALAGWLGTPPSASEILDGMLRGILTVLNNQLSDVEKQNLGKRCRELEFCPW